MRKSDMSRLHGRCGRYFVGRTNLFRRIAGFSLLSALCMSLIGFTLASAGAQNAKNANGPAIRSRAEQEAEQKVALSPDKIIDLLRQEPGLLLQVKKML